ncbi:MAG: 3-oxoacyl-[acyl-carrier-protein] reductase [Peptococcaceae bacterium]
MGMVDGKTAIVTGSGRGIGRAVVLKLASEGAAVIVNDIDPVPAEETVAAIKSIGGKAVACVGDVTVPDFGDRIVKMALDNFGSVDIIVNNAGYTWDGMIHKMTDRQWYAMIDVHLTSSFRVIRAAANYIRETAKKEMGEGKRVMRKIVNVMSIAGTQGNAGQANYSSAKAGLGGLTKTMAREWGQFNVNSNAVAFGIIETRLTDEKEKGLVLEDAEKKISLGIPKNIRQRFADSVPLRRFGLSEEAAGGVFFLCSPLSDYVNGHILLIDGGLDM